MVFFIFFSFLDDKTDNINIINNNNSEIRNEKIIKFDNKIRMEKFGENLVKMKEVKFWIFVEIFST